MERLKLWPHLALIATISAVLAGVVAALWVNHEQKVQAEALPNVARIERVEGEAGLNRSLDQGANSDWVAVTPNTPISVGDRIFTRENAHAAIAFTGRNFARLEPVSSLDLLNFSDQSTQVALRDGRGLFDVGYLPNGDQFEVATPYGAVDLLQPGLYEVGVNDNGTAFISVLSGLAQVVGLAGSGQISRGEMLTLAGATAADIILNRIEPGYAGSLVNDYYGYRYPRLYDGRYATYDAYLNDPYYYDPYRRYTSYQYVGDYIPGSYDLDDYGDWRYVNNYGYGWCPHVDSDWAPYQSGSWTMDYPYGLTWVSNEPWGYAPYHYGRWAYVQNQWFWIPDRSSTRSTYSPALVAFVPVTDANTIGWVPLAPRDPYLPRYYDDNWQPHYLTRTEVIQQRVVNLDAPGAVTFVDASEFDGPIDRRLVKRLDRQNFAGVRPVLDPLAVNTMRELAFKSRRGERRIALPRSVARHWEGTDVVATSAPASPRFGKDLARRLRVQEVPAGVRNAKLRFKDERVATSDSQRQQIGATEAARGARESQMRQVWQQQRQAEVEARQLRQEHDRKQQVTREVIRQQAAVERQERRNATQQQRELLRQANQQAPARREQEAAARRWEQRSRVEYKAPPQREIKQRQQVEQQRRLQTIPEANQQRANQAQEKAVRREQQRVEYKGREARPASQQPETNQQARQQIMQQQRSARETTRQPGQEKQARRKGKAQ